MGIIEFMIIALLLGLAVWAINKYTPIPGQIKTLILVAVIIVLVIMLLHAMGLIGLDWRIPRVSVS